MPSSYEMNTMGMFAPNNGKPHYLKNNFQFQFKKPITQTCRKIVMTNYRDDQVGWGNESDKDHTSFLWSQPMANLLRDGIMISDTQILSQ